MAMKQSLLGLPQVMLMTTIYNQNYQSSQEAIIVADEYLEPQNFSKKIRILYLEPQKVLRTSEVLSTILRTSDILKKHVFSINLFFLTCKYEICCMDMQKPEEFSMKSIDLRLIIQSNKININV